VTRRLHVLVMPEQFPRHPGDIAGVFSLDYVAAIRPFCDVTLLMPGDNDRPGLARTRTDGGDIERIIWTPRLRNGGPLRQRLGRLESLYGLGRLEGSLPRVDLIHAHGAVFHGLPALRLRRKLGVPVVLTIHTGPFSKLLRRATVRSLTRRTLEGVDCVCPVSHDLRQQIEAAGIRPKRVEVTHNPVDTDLFKPVGPPGKLHKRIVFAGRLEEYKGGLRVVRAFAKIADRWPDWTLAIAGDGPERPAIEQFVDQYPALGKRVELLGSCTRPELAGLFATSDCVVCPSRHETFGLILAEAMSSGLPVIGPDRTAPPEFIDSRSGILVPPDDLMAIADKMEQLLTQLHTFRRDDIRDVIVQRFGYAAFGRRLVDVYQDLCEPSGTRVCAVSPA
jgi:teichuronic acid biosynthesis glycosyltransferase TuaC